MDEGVLDVAEERPGGREDEPMLSAREMRWAVVVDGVRSHRWGRGGFALETELASEPRPGHARYVGPEDPGATAARGLELARGWSELTAGPAES